MYFNIVDRVAHPQSNPNNPTPHKTGKEVVEFSNKTQNIKLARRRCSSSSICHVNTKEIIKNLGDTRYNNLNTIYTKNTQRRNSINRTSGGSSRQTKYATYFKWSASLRFYIKYRYRLMFIEASCPWEEW